MQDGPVPDALAAAIADLVAGSPVPVEHLVLGRQRRARPGPGRGLAACAHEIVARMDADDVSLPTRFEAQLPLVEAGADIVGTGLLEFGSSPEDVVGRRTPPTDPDEIRRVIRFRDPFNHPTVVYRRSAVLAAGGYTDMALMEDYLLFARMVAGGRPAGQPRRAAGLLPGRGRRLRPAGWAAAAALGAGRAADASASSGSPPARSTSATCVVRGGYRLVPERLRTVAYRCPDRQPWCAARRLGRRPPDRLPCCCPHQEMCVEP